jgi:hypothetical protein
LRTTIILGYRENSAWKQNILYHTVAAEKKGCTPYASSWPSLVLVPCAHSCDAMLLEPVARRPSSGAQIILEDISA